MSIHNSVRQMLESHLTNTTEETPPACLLDKVPAKPRAILDREKAIEIFKLKKTCEIGRGKLSSVAVAREYGVGEKTVRDIWRGRTWRQETCHLDPSRPLHAAGPPGRPLGRKDTAPRKRPASTKRRDNSGESSPTGVHDEHESDPFHEDWPNWAGANCAPEVEADAIPDVTARIKARRQPDYVQCHPTALPSDADNGWYFASARRHQAQDPQAAAHTEFSSQLRADCGPAPRPGTAPSILAPAAASGPRQAMPSRPTRCEAPPLAQGASAAGQWPRRDVAGPRDPCWPGCGGERGHSPADMPRSESSLWPQQWS